MRPRPLAVAPLRPLAAALLTALLLAGCGSGQTVRVTDHHLALTLEEYRILPQTVSVPAGPLTIAACNRGILTHNVALERGSLDSDERTTLIDIPTLLPGRCGSRRGPATDARPLPTGEHRRQPSGAGDGGHADRTLSPPPVGGRRI